MLSTTEIHIVRLKASAGIRVTYNAQGETRSIDAVPATSTARLVGSDGSYKEMPVDDWIVLVADLVGLTSEPKQGHTISVDGATYLVNHPDEKTPVYENFNQLDRPAKGWRIHTFNPCDR